MRSKLFFPMTWSCMSQIKLIFMQWNMVKVILTFWRLKLGFLLQFYCCKGYRNLYWSDVPDTHIDKVSCATSRNRFWEILSDLDLADSTEITENRYYKVRVLFEKLSFNLKEYASFVNHSVDESIIPYYGKHSTK